MSGLYYVLVKCPNSSSGNRIRCILCLNSRYEADELFRAMQELKMDHDLDKPLFSVCTRKSPQLWYHASTVYRDYVILGDLNGLEAFKDTLSLLLAKWDCPTLPIITNPVIGPDWVNGSEFFIRNRRQPSQYWAIHGNDKKVHASEKLRSKFRITITNCGSRKFREPTILIRSDTVKVQVIAETITSAAAVVDDQEEIFISSSGVSGSALNITNEQGEEQLWSFGELLNKSVGVKWFKGDGCRGEPTAKPLVVHMKSGGGDEWELC